MNRAHRYRGGVWGLTECTIEVLPGRVVALVGPNGSGKTTLLNMAAGLLPATTGSVRIADVPPVQRQDQIGYVAQDAPLWPRLRVADVLEIGACLNPRFDTRMALRGSFSWASQRGHGSTRSREGSEPRSRSLSCWRSGRS